MNEITLNTGNILRATAQNGKIELMCVPMSGEAAPVLLAEISDVYCTRPYLYIDTNETLWLFYTAIQCADENSSQPMFKCAKKRSYSESFVKWDMQDAIYPRLGGSFTDARESDGVNEETDAFAPVLCGRYEKIGKLLAEKPGFSAEAFHLYVQEKRSLALGKLFGVKISKNNYPFARRMGFALKGAPLELTIDGKNALILPVYSNIFSCALLLYSFDGGRNFDSADYVLCQLGEDDEFVLKTEGRFICLTKICRDIQTVPQSSVPVGRTSDLGKTWEALYDYSDFDFHTDIGEPLKPEPNWRKQYKIKILSKPAPVKFFRLAKTLAHNERIFDFSKKKTADTPAELYNPVKIRGLDGYGVPVIEDIFPLIKEHAHGSGIVRLHNGELLSAWFQSDGERRGNDGRILASRKPVNGGWQETFVIADVAGMADCNPIIYVDQSENLWLCWYPVLTNCWESSQPKYFRAKKGCYEYANGYTGEPKWEKFGILNPARVNELQGRATGFEQGSYIYSEVNGECRYITAEQFAKNPLPEREYVKIEDRYITDSFVTALRNSMWDTVKFVRTENPYPGLSPAFEFYIWWEAERICKVAAGVESAYKKWHPVSRFLGWQTKNKPIEFDYQGKTRLLIPLYSDGLHCSLTAYTDDGGETWGYGLPFGSTAPEQAASVALKNGALRSYFRNGEPTGRVIYYESTDGGENFGNMHIEQALRHEGGFDVVKLKNGVWVMSITEPYVGKGIKGHNRSLLNIAVSTDEGKTWNKTSLEVDTNGRKSFHYSAITQGDDGNIYVSYSHDDEKGMNNIRCATIKHL